MQKRKITNNSTGRRARRERDAHRGGKECQRAPIDPGGYAVPLTPAELQRLRRIFPGGVCDWSKPGVNQVPVVPWTSFGPAPAAPPRESATGSR